MRTFRHWSPRYIRDRITSNLYRKRYPERPWLTPAANDFLDSFLKNTDIGLEFGSGFSTLWFAKRLQHLISIEHNEAWFRKVQEMLKESRQDNVDYHLVLKDKEGEEGIPPGYVKEVDTLGVTSFDFVLIDGIYRDHCAQKTLDIIRPGGILVIDNVNNYLPSDSHAPNSRTYEQGPKGEVWDKVHQTISQWRSIWTSTGVWDTAIFFRPCN